MNLSFRQLRVFLEVVQQGSVTRAAEVLHLTPPAVSMQIKELESQVGLQLFDRVGRTLSLSTAGEYFVVHAKRMLGALRDAENAMGRFKRLESGLLTVGMVSTAKYFVPRLLALFRQDHPGIDVRLVVAANREALIALPASVNVWRTFLQWQGGMGILILAVAILPMLGVGGSQLFRAEAAGPLKDAKLTPRITQTAKGLWAVYFVFSLACFGAYWAGGMDELDALKHMFSTVSLGGLSSHDASFGHFESPLLEAIAVFFMLLCSCNFALYFIAVRKRSLRPALTDPELRATLTVMIGGVLIVTLVLILNGTYAPLTALRHAAFNVVSIASTTGYASVDYLQWPVFAPAFMLLLSGLATSAGSTGCGIKMVRLLILLKQARRELTRIVHPRAVQPVTLGGQTVGTDVIFAVLGYMLVYGVSIIGFTMLMLMSDIDLDTAVSAVVASIHCMGPGMGSVGPAGNYQHLTDYQTWVLSLAMLVGRVELLAFMVLFTPQFWRK